MLRLRVIHGTRQGALLLSLSLCTAGATGTATIVSSVQLKGAAASGTTVFQIAEPKGALSDVGQRMVNATSISPSKAVSIGTAALGVNAKQSNGVTFTTTSATDANKYAPATPDATVSGTSVARTTATCTSSSTYCIYAENLGGYPTGHACGSTGVTCTDDAGAQSGTTCPASYPNSHSLPSSSNITTGVIGCIKASGFQVVNGGNTHKYTGYDPNFITYCYGTGVFPTNCTLGSARRLSNGRDWIYRDEQIDRGRGPERVARYYYVKDGAEERTPISSEQAAEYLRQSGN